MKASPAARSRADQILADRRQLELIGVRAAAKFGAQARLHAIAAFRTGNDPVRAVTAVLRGDERLGLPGIQTLIRDSMVAAHMKGRWRSNVFAAPRFRSKARYKLAGTAYDDALEFLKRRIEMNDAEMADLVQKYNAEALKVTNVVSAELETKLRKTLYETTAAGMHVNEGIKSLKQAFTDSGWVPGENWKLENTFRTQTQMAYGAGRWNANQDPAVQEILWGYEYVTIGDDRVRPNHAAMDGVRRPKDDPMWSIWWPPVGYNCRCTTLEIFDKGKATEKLPEVQPDKGWAWNPGQVFKDMVQPKTAVPAVRP